MTSKDISHRWHTFSAGCALFAMLFGAANVVLPLILGRAFGTLVPFALIGFVLTAVLIPLIGFVSVTLAQGDYVIFLNKLGRVPALLVGLLCMTLLGPVGAIPRCIAIAHADLSWYLPDLSTWLFSGIAAGLIWLCTYQKTHVIDILGRYLGPLKILCLLAIVVLGLLSPGAAITPENIDTRQSFFRGFYDGYGTMDLLAIIFFSQLVYSSISRGMINPTPQNLFKKALWVSLIAGGLLALVYIGFAGIAALHGPRIANVADDTLLSALASTVLGAHAGLFVNITIAITCLVTAIALTSTFADFLSRDLCRQKISYQTALVLTVIGSGLMANLRFSGIMKTILPWISFCYPALMVFAVLHIVMVLKSWSPLYARVGFFITLGITASMYLLQIAG